MKTCGIYRISVNRGEKAPMFYIGQSVNIRERIAAHLRQLRRGDAKNPILQRAFDFYGEKAFSFEILEECAASKEVLAIREKFLLDAQIMATGNGSVYNILRESTTSRLGTKASDATRQRMSIAQKECIRTDAQLRHLKALADSNRGKKLSEDSIAKRTLKQTGLTRTDETKRRMSEVRLGKNLTPEHVENMRAAKMASGWKPSAEHAEKLRLAHVGKPMHENTRAAILAARIGSKMSPEALAKRTETRRINAAAKGKAY